MCSSSDEEVRLDGRLTEVVRVGSTVRRPVGEHTPAVHALLEHLEEVGFDGAPAVHGVDDRGREILDHLPGDVTYPPHPDYVWSEQTLHALGAMVRDYHDAVADFEAPPDAVWASAPHPDYPVEVICHNDLAPWNTVFRDRRPAAFIDWDWAGPGARAWDLAFVIWQWVPLMPPWRREQVGAPTDLDWKKRSERLCSAYGTALDESLIEVVVARQQATYEGLRRMVDAGDESHVRLWAQAGDGLVADIEFTEELLRAYGQ